MDTRVLSNGLSKEIDAGLIESCEKISIECGEIMFIFDKMDSFDNRSDLEEREVMIDSILDGLFIGSQEDFGDHVSRWTYYDTVTKTTNQSLRYHKAYTFITEKIGLFEKKPILDPTKEVVFFNEGIRLALKPNLMISISYFSDNKQEAYGMSFFDPKWIKKCITRISEKLSLEEKRNLKLNMIL
jgi:hypothetical protein